MADLVTQIAVEVLESHSPNARVTQIAVEVLRTFAPDVWENSFTASAWFAARHFRADAVLVLSDGNRWSHTRESYLSTVRGDGASGLWKLDDTVSNNAYVEDVIGGHTGVITSFWWQTPEWTTWFTRGVVGPPNGKTGWTFGSGSGGAPPIVIAGYQQAGSKCSIEAWIKVPPSVTGTQILWTAGDGLQLKIASGKLVFTSIRDGQVAIQTNATYNDDVLHHIVAVWDGVDGSQMLSSQLLIYVDAVSVPVTSSGPNEASGWVAPYVSTSTEAILSGSEWYGWPNSWRGFLDEVAHYNDVALTPDQIAFHNWLGRSAMLNPDISANAVVKGFSSHSIGTSAYIVNPYRATHDRGDGYHYDLDLDTVILIAQALGVYPLGTDLHTVLAGIFVRLRELEGVSNDFPVEATAALDAIIYREWAKTLDIGAAISLLRFGSFPAEAIVSIPRLADGSVDSVLLREQEHAAEIDSIVRAERTGQSSADALLLVVGTGGQTADAIIQREQIASLATNAFIYDGSTLQETTSDAIIMATQSHVASADAIARIERTNVLLADAVVHKAMSSTLSVNAIVNRERSSSGTASAIVRKNVVVAGVPDTLNTIDAKIGDRPGNARVTQIVAEVLESPSPNARVTQIVAEVLEASDTSLVDARVTQIVAEVLESHSPNARVTQVAVEVLANFPRFTVNAVVVSFIGSMAVDAVISS